MFTNTIESLNINPVAFFDDAVNETVFTFVFPSQNFNLHKFK